VIAIHRGDLSQLCVVDDGTSAPASVVNIPVCRVPIVVVGQRFHEDGAGLRLSDGHREPQEHRLSHRVEVEHGDI
jgi:hypothetical protein